MSGAPPPPERCGCDAAEELNGLKTALREGSQSTVPALRKFCRFTLAELAGDEDLCNQIIREHPQSHQSVDGSPMCPECGAMLGDLFQVKKPTGRTA